MNLITLVGRGCQPRFGDLLATKLGLVVSASSASSISLSGAWTPVLLPSQLEWGG